VYVPCREVPVLIATARFCRQWVLVLLLLAAFSTGAPSSASAQAVTLYATTSTNQLMTLDASSPGTALSTIAITGLQGGETILGIDVRPATQVLYALGSTSRLYTINPANGVATAVNAPFTPALSGTAFGFDFNPVADRIRVVSNTEQNLRLNPATGAVAAIDITLNSSSSPVGDLVAAAYTNNFSGAAQTTLYAIDAVNDQLMLIGGVNGTPSANGGALTVVGPLGFDTSTLVGFDIASNGTAYAALRIGGIGSLFTIDLTTGAATQVGTLPAVTFTGLAVKSAPAPPALTLTPSVLNFGAINDSGTLTTMTPAQTLRLTLSNSGTVTWTATSNVSWLSLTPGSGSGAATLVASINAGAASLPAPGTAAATITVSAVGAANSPTATVNLNLLTPAQGTAPVGVIDTPVDGQGNVTGAIPVTGWAVDDVGVTRVRILRNPIAGEDPSQLVPIGDAVFVAGARPDVAATYPSAPLKDQAGWGYMLLTNALPNQGNGTFTLVAYADDAQGRTTLLGSRTISCTNATATAPFGTIDTPAQGATIAGSAYANIGWALTPQPNIIPTDGSTIHVFIDSVSIGTLHSYNNARADIQAIFPGYQNTDGAVGVRVIDTTALANGVHTIAWGVIDSAGTPAGIGSRYFTVSNSGGGSLVSEPASVVGRVINAAGAVAENPPALAVFAPEDVRHFRVVQLERIEIQIDEDARPGATYRGYEIAGDHLAALPAGSHLDAKTGVLSWAPGLGFGGVHELLFVRNAAGAQRQIRVDVKVDAQREVQNGARVVIDMPAAGEVGQRFVVAGWAIDPAGAPGGTGIDVLHVWAHPVDGSAPRFVNVAAYGGLRPDVAKAFGDRFLRSGFGVELAGLPPGNYDVVVYGLSQATREFSVAGSVRVTVR
jgi:hypothetical protein